MLSSGHSTAPAIAICYSTGKLAVPERYFHAAAVASVENRGEEFVLLNPGAETLNWHEQGCSQLNYIWARTLDNQDVILSSSTSQMDKGSSRTGEDVSKAICKLATSRSATRKLGIRFSMEDSWAVCMVSREM